MHYLDLLTAFTRQVRSKYLLFFLLFAACSPAYGRSGDLDPSFGIGGVTTAQIGKYSFDQIFAAALQPDGKVVIAGDSLSDSTVYSAEPTNFIVSRVNADGSFDTSFGFHGIVSKRFGSFARATSIAIQADGRIVIGGYTFKNYGQLTGFKRVMFLMRFDTTGSVDTSFGSSGLVITDLPGTPNAQLNGITLQADGKIVTAGYSYLTPSTSPISVVAARYNMDGSPDTNFDTDGVAFIDINPGAGNRGNAVAIQSDGKIVIGGLARDGSTTVNDFAVVRLNANGSLDTGFDGDGKTTTKFGTTSSNIIGIRVSPDGKIVAVGNSVQGGQRDIALARYNPDGSPDSSFDGDGKLLTNLGDETAGGMALQPDGKIIVCGMASLSGELLSLTTIRYNTDGSFDNTFNGNGRVITAVPEKISRGNAAIVRGDGKIVVAGYTTTFDESDFAIARYNSDGSPDISFDADGVSVIEPGNAADHIFKTALQSDGKIIAAGQSFGGVYDHLSISRFDRTGSLDPGFGIQGVVTLRFANADAFINDVLVQPDGKILLSVSVTGNQKFTFYRLNPDGSPDNSFGTAGVAIIQVGTAGDSPGSMALQPDGKIVSTGHSDMSDSGGPAIVRLNPDGTPDATFGSGGKVVTTYPNISNYARAVAVQSDGKIIIAGDHQSGSGYSLFVSRYTSSGALDTSFGGGIVYTSIGTFIHIETVALQPDSRLLALGYSDSRTAVARYNTDGSLDNSFDGDGKLIIGDDGNTHYEMKDLILQPNGKLVMSGLARYGFDAGSDEDGAVIRLNADGSPDQTFGTAGKTITSMGSSLNGFYSISRRPDGRIYGGGYSSNSVNDDFTVAAYNTGIPPGFDFDGDGKTDIAVFRPSEGNWYVQNSLTIDVSAVHFGQTGDLTTPGDFDGDGKADIAVFRPSEGNWYRLNSSDGSFTGLHFGTSEDKPAVGDFDGDGRADISVFRPSEGNWYRLNSSDGTFIGLHFGVADDKPTVGDFDGDGRADISVFRPSEGNWYRLNSLDGSFAGLHFGFSGDKPTVGDFDGDGRTDIAVFRPSEGNWYRLNSSDGSFFGTHFGVAEDKPVAADFDGDGKTDIGVFRPSEGNWYILNSTAGFTAQHFGLAEDTPTANSFVY